MFRGKISGVFAWYSFHFSPYFSSKVLYSLGIRILNSINMTMEGTNSNQLLKRNAPPGIRKKMKEA